jgi:uncharacterized OB-fold protein
MSERVPFHEGLFVEDAEGARLIANKCRSCGQIFFPSKNMCLECFGEELEEVSLSRKGKLYTYAISRVPVHHYNPPHATGYIDLPEGVRVFAPIKGWEEHPLKIGMEMELIIDKLWEEEGKDMIGYKFRPVQ